MTMQPTWQPTAESRMHAEIERLRRENAELHTALSACVRFLDGDYLMQIKVWARENGASIRTTPPDMDVNYMRGLIERTRPDDRGA